MKIEEMSDLELAETLNQIWGQLVTLENNLKVVQAEINKRKETAKDNKDKK